MCWMAGLLRGPGKEDPLMRARHATLPPAIDRYKRPYEGTDSPAAAMQAYLDWEYGLVEQLNRDGTHGFRAL
jgi:hypothetical protein